MTIITKHNPKFHNAFPYFDRPVLIITQLARNQFSGKPHNYTLNNCNYNYSSKPDIEQTLIRKERKKNHQHNQQLSRSAQLNCNIFSETSQKQGMRGLNQYLRIN